MTVVTSPASRSPPAVAAPPGNPRFPLMDGMRAFAALSILATHAAGLDGFNIHNRLGAYTARLNIGVTVFFLISGFLLYRPFVAARVRGTPPIRWLDFFRRRALRIIPAYWVALTILGIWPGLPGWDGPFTHGWLELYDFTWIYDPFTAPNGIYPAWSLAVEVTYYLLLPLMALVLAWLVGRRRHRVGLEIAVLLAVALASLGVRYYLHDHAGVQTSRNTLASYIDWFCYGMILAVLSVHWQGREASVPGVRTVVRRPWIAWAAAAAVFWYLSTQMGLPRYLGAPQSAGSDVAEQVVLALCAALLLLPSIFGASEREAITGWPRRLLAHPIVAWLGLVSYGIFLYHGPTMRWLYDHDLYIKSVPYLSLVAVSTVVAVACAAASYYAVERPALRFKK